MPIAAQEKKYTEKLPWQQILSLSSANFSQAVMLTTPFTIGVFMVRDFLASKRVGSAEAVDEQLVGQLTGLLAGIFSFSSFLTAYAWGCASNYIGRKPVIAIGNFVSFVSILWFGLSGSYGTALAARAFGGFFNGILGAWKCMIGESTAVLLQGKFFGYMSLAWGLGCIAGPALGGVLSRPCSRAPHLALCGETGLLRRRPYFLACAVGSLTILAAFLLSVLLLEETLPAAMRAKGLGAAIRRRIQRRRRERRRLLKYTQQQQQLEDGGEEADEESDASSEFSAQEGLRGQLSVAVDSGYNEHRTGRRSWLRRQRRRRQQHVQQQSNLQAAPAAASQDVAGGSGSAEGDSCLERAALLPGGAEAPSDALPEALLRAPTHNNPSYAPPKTTDSRGSLLRRVVLGSSRAPARPGLPPDLESDASFLTVSEFSDSAASTDPWDGTDTEDGRGGRGRGGDAGDGEAPTRTPSLARLQALLRLASRTYIDFNPFRRSGSLRGQREAASARQPPPGSPPVAPAGAAAETTIASVALALRPGGHTDLTRVCTERMYGGGETVMTSSTMHGGVQRRCDQVPDGKGLADVSDDRYGCKDRDSDQGGAQRELGASGRGGGDSANGVDGRSSLPADCESRQRLPARGCGGSGDCGEGSRWESTSTEGAGSSGAGDLADSSRSGSAQGPVTDGATEATAAVPMPCGSSRQLAESPGVAGAGVLIRRQDQERTPLLQPTRTPPEGEPQQTPCGYVGEIGDGLPGGQGPRGDCDSGDDGQDGDGGGGGGGSSGLAQRVSPSSHPCSLHGSSGFWDVGEGEAGEAGDEARESGDRAGRARAAMAITGRLGSTNRPTAAAGDCAPAAAADELCSDGERRREPGGEEGVAVLVDVAREEEPSQARSWYRCPQVVLTILGYGAVALIFCALDEVFPIYASAPLDSGGLGMREEQLAPPLMFFGIILMPYSLYVYPPLQRHVGTLRLTMVGLVVAFLTCFMLPLVADVRAASFVGAQVLLYGTMVFKAFAQCSAFTGSIIAVNAAPAQEQLGAVNGVGQTLAALVRGVGPALGGVLWSVSLGLHSTGQQFLTFAIIAGVAAATCGLYAFVRLPGMR